MRRSLGLFLDRVLCRLIGRHAWCQTYLADAWFCLWCGKRRDGVEVKQ